MVRVLWAKVRERTRSRNDGRRKIRERLLAEPHSGHRGARTRGVLSRSQRQHDAGLDPPGAVSLLVVVAGSPVDPGPDPDRSGNPHVDAATALNRKQRFELVLDTHEKLPERCNPRTARDEAWPDAREQDVVAVAEGLIEVGCCLAEVIDADLACNLKNRVMLALADTIQPLSVSPSLLSAE